MLLPGEVHTVTRTWSQWITAEILRATHHTGRNILCLLRKMCFTTTITIQTNISHSNLLAAAVSNASVYWTFYFNHLVIIEPSSTLLLPFPASHYPEESCRLWIRELKKSDWRFNRTWANLKPWQLFFKWQLHTVFALPPDWQHVSMCVREILRQKYTL